MLRIGSLLLFFIVAIPISAADIYVAQVSAGGNTGADCADARAVSSLAVGDYVGDNVLHLCGTLTVGFSILGSGTSGHVITIKWESGARVSVAFGGIINVGSNGFLLFDGGIPCGPGTSCDQNESASPIGYPAGITGIIEATANGSALANQNTSTQAFYGCNGCHDIEWRNLIPRNLYQHTLTTDATPNADSGSFFFQCSSGAASPCTGNFLIHDMDMHDMGNMISLQKFSSATINIYNIDCWRDNWCVENSGNGTRTLAVHDSHFHDAVNWDSPATNPFHHNGIHEYMNVSSDSFGDYDYNIRVDGDWGTCCTTSNFDFVEFAPPSLHYIYNNVVIQKCNNTEPGLFTRTQNAGNGPVVINNTFLGCATVSGNVEAVQWNGSTQSDENNAIQGYGQYVTTTAVPASSTLDYNIYGSIGISGNSPWQCGPTGANTLAAWQAACGEGAHSQKVSTLNVTASGVPNAGSPLIGAGNNFTSTCVVSIFLNALCFDINGNIRPTSGAWTVGAFNLPVPPNPPTALHVVVIQ